MQAGMQAAGVRSHHEVGVGSVAQGGQIPLVQSHSQTVPHVSLPIASFLVVGVASLLPHLTHQLPAAEQLALSSAPAVPVMCYLRLAQFYATAGLV